MQISIHNTKGAPTLCPEFDCEIRDDAGNVINNITSITIHLDANESNKLIVRSAKATTLDRVFFSDIHMDRIEIKTES